jgi:hypothetical protein
MSRWLTPSGTSWLVPDRDPEPPDYTFRGRSARISERVIRRGYSCAVVPLTRLSLPVLEAKQARIDTTSPEWV